MRLIDADALKEKLERHLSVFPKFGTDKMKIRRDEIINCIADVVNAPTVREWIPVSERLPNEDGEYLVFYEGPIVGSRIETMWYGEPLMPNVDVSGKHFYKSDSEWGDIIYDEVIAWMPLSEPYREDGGA